MPSSGFWFLFAPLRLSEMTHLLMERMLRSCLPRIDGHFFGKLISIIREKQNFQVKLVSSVVEVPKINFEASHNL